MLARKLTTQQKDILIGKMFNNDSYFNPVIDASNEWVISEEVFQSCTLIKAIELGIENWFPNLPQKDSNPVITI